MQIAAVRFVAPAAFASGASGTALWTAATDLAPGGATKPVVTLSCPSVTETLISAISTRIKMGNMQNRFSPEIVENFVETAFAYAARVQDTNLLTQIGSYSTLVSSGQLLGASRDLLATVDQATAAYRYRTRIPRTQRIDLIFPEWVKDLMRADITREAAHATASDDPLAVTDARIESWFSVRNLTPVWTLDAQGAVTGALPSVNQAWGAQSTNSLLNGWPTQVVWWMFAEGTIQLLDGGTLEFSVVRDSTLDSTNDVELITEVFENIAFRGLESLQVVSQVKANGASAGSVPTASSPNIY